MFVGYIVASGLRKSHGVQGLRILIQSDKPAAFVEKRAEAFLRYFQVCDGIVGVALMCRVLQLT